MEKRRMRTFFCVCAPFFLVVFCSVLLSALLSLSLSLFSFDLVGYTAEVLTAADVVYGIFVLLARHDDERFLWKCWEVNERFVLQTALFVLFFAASPIRPKGGQRLYISSLLLRSACPV